MNFRRPGTSPTSAGDVLPSSIQNPRSMVVYDKMESVGDSCQILRIQDKAKLLEQHKYLLLDGRR
jgi:hypothetical protein